jgi:hypothetical protein
VERDGILGTIQAFFFHTPLHVCASVPFNTSNRVHQPSLAHSPRWCGLGKEVVGWIDISAAAACAASIERIHSTAIFSGLCLCCNFTVDRGWGGEVHRAGCLETEMVGTSGC